MDQNAGNLPPPLPRDPGLGTLGSPDIDEPMGRVEMVPRAEAQRTKREQDERAAAQRMDIPASPPFMLTSAVLADGGTLPVRNTADGDDVSPALSWGDPPARTESFAVLCEDLDAPSGVFVHWMVWDIPAAARELPEGVETRSVIGEMVQGQNAFGSSGYRGPSPPPGAPHHYVFHLYALDTRPELSVGAIREEFDRAIAGHMLAEAKLIGIYGRTQPH